MNSTAPTLSAVELCELGIARYARWRADALNHLNASMALDERLALPRLVKAWILQIGRDGRFSGKVDELMSEAGATLNKHDSREQGLLSALRLAHAGFSFESARVLASMLDQSPTDLLLHQLVHEELFWAGRSDWMREITEKAAPAWDQTSPDYGPFLSLRAFANEEAGDLKSAERFGRLAVEIDSTDIWGAHAVAHVLLMKAEFEAGIDWLQTLSPNWVEANQMRHHLWWHMCLFLIETGDHDRIISLLTSEVRNPESALVRAAPAAAIDITNFSSILLRLELVGVDVGDLWQTLGEICANRVHNHGNVFANCHDIMVLAATAQFDKADQMLASMRACYQSAAGSVADAYNAVGISACEALLAHRKQDYQAVITLLSESRHKLSLMGASHAQRDVFSQILFDAALRTGNDQLGSELIGEIGAIGFRQASDRKAYRSNAR